MGALAERWCGGGVIANHTVVKSDDMPRGIMAIAGPLDIIAHNLGLMQSSTVPSLLYRLSP